MTRYDTILITVFSLSTDMTILELAQGISGWLVHEPHSPVGVPMKSFPTYPAARAYFDERYADRGLERKRTIGISVKLAH